VSSDPIHYGSIRIRPPMSRIYARLGYRRSSTVLSEAEGDYIERIVQEASDLIELRGASLLLDMEGFSDAGVRLSGGVSLKSSTLARMLQGCSGALLMAATAGPAVMDAVRRCSEGDLTRAVVLDAVGSEMADAALDWIMGVVGQDLLRSARRLTRRRFSSGYADLALESQKVMHEVLRLDEIGIGITASMILVPEKSVTAIAGVMSRASG